MGQTALKDVCRQKDGFIGGRTGEYIVSLQGSADSVELNAVSALGAWDIAEECLQRDLKDGRSLFEHGETGITLA
ncbi:hypothetical protein GCM10010349_74990 [Streptomyces flavofungini]|nr:hypothetical protein GCM10010349_74990 [Streptomyces flavofungini]